MKVDATPILVEPRFRAPQQARSEATLQRLLDAAEVLLEEQPFGVLTVRDLVTHAGVTTGSFYARFADKDACIQAVFTRFLDRASAGSRFKVDREAATNEALAQFIYVSAKHYRQKRGLFRALTTYIQTNPDSEIALLGRSIGKDFSQRFAALLLTRREEIAHPEPEVAARFGIAMMFHALRDGILVGPFDPHVHMTDRVFAEEVTRTLLRYLGFDRVGPTTR